MMKKLSKLVNGKHSHELGIFVMLFVIMTSPLWRHYYSIIDYIVKIPSPWECFPLTNFNFFLHCSNLSRPRRPARKRRVFWHFIPTQNWPKTLKIDQKHSKLTKKQNRDLSGTILLRNFTLARYRHFFTITHVCIHCILSL